MGKWFFATFLFLCAAPGVEAAYERIVSAGGDITEIVHALGAADRIVAVDSTSNHPAEMRGKAQIGYLRRLAAEGVLSLQPDLVLAAYDAGPPVVLDQLRAAGLTVALAPRGDSPEGVLAKIRFVGEVLGLEAEAGALIGEIAADMKAVGAAADAIADRPRVIFVLSLRDGAPLVGGRDTAADAIIALAGGINAAAGFESYKPMSRESIIEAQPDVLLMMRQSVDQLGGIDRILARPDFALTPAGRDKRYVAMEGMLLLGFGPRLPQAVGDLAAGLRCTGRSGSTGRSCRP